jgi:REP element-mobilizing transposase RayT
MARPLRVEYSGGCYHVINRGNYRRDLFGQGGGAEAFERTLGEAAERFDWAVHAYVIMRNHFHLAVELNEPNLSDGMKWLQGTWIRRYNGFRKLVGRPFQGRYKALVVEPGPHFAKVCHYIHLNPVRAKVVEPSEAATYRWCSLYRFPLRKRPAWLAAGTVLEHAGSLPDTKAGWRRYLSYLEFLATDDETKREMVCKNMSRGWCLGGREFKQELKQEALRRGADVDRERYVGLGPAEARLEREAAWEDRLRHLARAAKVDLEKLPERKSAGSKVLLAAAMKQSTSVSNGWLANRLAMGKPASVSQFARRLMLQENGKRGVEKLLSRVKT